MTFEEIDGLQCSEQATQWCVEAGIREATPVQELGIPAILAGKAVILHSGTGTGKTLAYLLPVLQRLRETPGLRAVVFCPGAELAMQTFSAANEVKSDQMTVGAAITTTSRKRQRKRIQKSTRLIVGTPDRLIALFREKKLKKVGIIVLDELEPILSARDASFLNTLLKRSEPAVQLIVAAATLGKRSDAFIQEFMSAALWVEPEQSPLQENIVHESVRVGDAQTREIALVHFLERRRCKRAIVFVNGSRRASWLYHYLTDQGISTVTVSRERTKEQRHRSLEAFRAGKAQVLLTTDAAARGIDVPEIRWVLHFDLPRAAEAYIHRAGRTGRAGKKGTSVVFIDAESLHPFRRLQKALPVTWRAFK